MELGAAAIERDESAPARLNGGDGWKTYVEDWDPSYGTPSSFELDGEGTAEQAEPGAGPVIAEASRPVPLAFIDGTRRVELQLWSEHAATGERIPGLVGAYAVGATTIAPGQPAAYAGCRVGRLAIWGGGHTGDVVGRNGYRWASSSIATTEVADLVPHLQDRMRQAEGELALDAADRSWNVVLDGPLNRIRSLHALVAGYVKTHHRVILPPADHTAVPSLDVGTRTRMFALGTDRFTCYCRIGHAGVGSSPWGGIARLEFPSAFGLDAAVDRATALTAVLPRYAGVAHRDPRAPVNLSPVKNLESHLSRLMGPADLATRAARDAVVTGAAR